MKKLIMKWLGIHTPPTETWTVVGYMDKSFTYTNSKKSGDFRVVFAISSEGRRKATPTHFDAYHAGVKQGWIEVMEVEGWLKGGPLPKNFIPMKIDDRRPSKLPPQIAHDFNSRKD